MPRPIIPVALGGLIVASAAQSAVGLTHTINRGLIGPQNFLTIETLGGEAWEVNVTLTKADFPRPTGLLRHDKENA